jgi:hypothetical protein
MERVAGNEQLHPLAPAQVGADNDPLGRAAAMQKQDLERVAEIVVVELVVTDSVKPHRCGRRHHEVERRPHWPGIGKRRRQSAGRDRLGAHVS